MELMTVGVSAAARRLEDIANGAPQATATAVTSAGRAVGRQVLRTLATETGLTSSRIAQMGAKGVRATPATAATPIYTIRIGPRVIQLIELRARQTGAGVDYRFRGGTRALPGAFIQTRLKRGIGVALRGSRERLPISRQFAPETLADLAESNMGFLHQFAEAELQKRFLTALETLASRPGSVGA